MAKRVQPSTIKKTSLFQDDPGFSAHADFQTYAYAHPAVKGVPTDPDVSSQTHLVGTWGLHADLVWPDYTGNGILLADLDDGFQYTLPDLMNNYAFNLDRDFFTGDSDAAPGTAYDVHGTAVMGVMVADDNGVGTVGVAFDAKGVGLRMSFDDDSLDPVVDALEYVISANIDVMNNSWGYSDAYLDDFADNISPSVNFADVAAAIKDAVDFGRGGLGANIVFAGGNDSFSGDNVNNHNLGNSPYTIAVGSINSDGIYTDFATPGAALLVSAIGEGVLTTDRTGKYGYTREETAVVDGTSFSCASVSGMIGLMLEANPNLGWRDVQQILAYSAQHNDPTSTSWAYNGATNWNGGGLHFSHQVGFGAADAHAAVRLAETWDLQQTSANMTTFTTATATPALAIPDESTVMTSMVVATDILIEHIEVRLDIDHTYGGDLIVTLISPDGTESVLVDRPGDFFPGSYSAPILFTMETNASWGETSAGTWDLRIQDDAAADTGTLQSWTITFMGSALPTDDLYVYTDDFGNFSAGELVTRGVLTDANGGTDTMNLATVTSDVTLDMNAGAGGTIAGNALSIAVGSVIENAYLGDGDDTVTGNASDNRILAGRGDDTVIGSDGNDTLDGGRGSDTLGYLESIANFTFNFISATLVNITHVVGAAWTDAASNFELFSFTEGTFTAFDLGGPALPPAPLTLTGTKTADVLTGGGGDDLLNGMRGADTMTGGLGDDTYIVDSARDLIVEGVGGGTDLVISSVTLTLAANVENLTFTGLVGARGTGNDLDNVITGNAGGNILNGGDGQDTLLGGAGSDTLIGGLSDDILCGQSGKDKLTGGDGADTFVFDGLLGADNADTVTDYKTADGDILDISNLLSGYDALTSVLSDFVQLAPSGSNTVLKVDEDGALNGQNFITVATLTGALGLDADDMLANGLLTLS